MYANYRQIRLFVITLALSVASTTLFSMVHDNRYIPLYAPPKFYFGEYPSFFSAAFFSANASRAFSETEKTIGIPELEGEKFDLGKLATAVEMAGFENPLRSDLRGVSLPFIVDGKINMLGFTILCEQSILGDFFCDWFDLSLGGSILFARANTTQRFVLNEHEVASLNLLPGDKMELEKTRREIFALLGFDNNHSAQVGFGDIDLHLRISRAWFYALKCRYVELGLAGGVLIPSGVTRENNAPSSIPFGGNGHWGYYLQADGLFEVKEDIKVGFLARVSDRRKTTKNRRMPVNGEPYIFGAIVGELEVDPGITAFVSPYVVLENLRDGFGLSLQYTATYHDEDEWRDRRKDKTIPTNLVIPMQKSEWSSDYMTISAFYDFGAIRPARAFDPIFSITWDFPVSFFVSKNFPKTNRVSIGVEFNY